METVLPAIALMACVLVALIVLRARGLLAHIAIEALLVLAIGSFLLWRGSSPLPYPGSIPAGLMGDCTRALAVMWWLIGARLIVNMAALARGRDPRSRNARLFSDLAAAVIYITTALIILNSVLELNVKGLLATSGVIAIVLGLALQNSLADVFSGIAVGLERSICVGDQVSVGDGVEGVIIQINWRSVRIQTDGDDLATVPNSIVAKAPIINRSVPTRRRAAVVEVVAPSHATSDAVIELLRQATLLCPKALRQPSPSITILRSGLHSATYAARFFVADSPDMSAAKSMLLRQARRLFLHAGIGHAAPLSTAELLTSLGIFEALTQEELDALTGTLVARSVEAGETIFQQGSPATSLYVIEAGVMELSRHTPEMGDEAASRIGPGTFIGELSLLTSAPRACTMTALSPGRVLELPGSALEKLQRTIPGLNTALERLAQRDRAAIDQADASHLETPAEPSVTILSRAKAILGL